MKKTIIALLSVAAFASSCKDAGKGEGNVLLQTFETPLGAPPFERIRLADYKPAFEEGIRRHEEEIRAIAENADEPTFENTIAAYDRSGELLGRVSGIFFNLQSANTSEEMLALAMEISPMVTAHSDAARMNEKLFARVKALYDRRSELGLDSLEMRTLEL